MHRAEKVQIRWNVSNVWSGLSELAKVRDNKQECAIRLLPRIQKCFRHTLQNWEKGVCCFVGHLWVFHVYASNICLLLFFYYLYIFPHVFCILVDTLWWNNQHGLCLLLADSSSFFICVEKGCCKSFVAQISLIQRSETAKAATCWCEIINYRSIIRFIISCALSHSGENHAGGIRACFPQKPLGLKTLFKFGRLIFKRCQSGSVTQTVI